ncbi:hypothetical protein DWY73_15555 [Bacteroides fragilis]|nr:hypothetical protein DWY73_15555 [Bacteroides fragilis]RHL59899.1 hypothetical protein DW010_07005 [Bacteroides stercoris]RHM65028.1 hypothetical protein DWZ57_04490 [Bacteroides fragilis]RJW95296.1 hypothetical protein DWZ55_17170 [Bacteroides sp. AF33-23]
MILNSFGVSIRTVSSFFGAICFRYSTSILAHCLSLYKGTIFFRYCSLSLSFWVAEQILLQNFH